MDVDANLDASEDVLLEVQKPTIGQNQYKNCRIEATVARRRLQLGLLGSTNTTKALTVLQKRQLVMDQLAQDPLNCCGPCIICEAIVAETGYLLISGKWLGLWVVPNNRLKTTIGYPLIHLVVNPQIGMPLQNTTDCGSVTTEMYGYTNALREYFSPHLSPDELPAHGFLKSVHNIIIEHGWHLLRIQWGDNVKVFGKQVMGYTMNNDHYVTYSNLVQWLWLRLIQQELNNLKHHFNTHVVRHDKDKLLLSGVSPNIVYALYKDYNAENCLQPVDCTIIKALMEEIGGEDFKHFATLEYSIQAQEVFNGLGFTELSFQNIYYDNTFLDL
ncbi:hypothetical protein SERLADRAFT_366542 [Serpula lacrymans var. lacrymans S7.9]|uniref:Uncharacterized protein n=1 Tax=Serpula lacrymans var. lacrymans (strain S7.9) TaxID=578457 RepID=F8NL60_SERL9|nr:uncharacterized protein SERLADRAFT_366542 [Serpula lacrymans var. lacrymans S7.9]EGO28876.1 hypothetical protein SERLADRAFT_366542 [Serpula lacrymans var. lacrymans S7.9]